MALTLEAVGRRIGPFTLTYGWKDVVLYALGVGAGFAEIDYCLRKVPQSDSDLRGGGAGRLHVAAGRRERLQPVGSSAR